MKITENGEIEIRFNQLAEMVFGISLPQYKSKNSERKIFGYAIHKETRSFSPIFGVPPAELTAAMNKRFHDTIAGYRVKVQDVFQIPGLNADVLLLSTELNSSSDHDLDAILLHELCHMVLDSKSTSLGNLIIDGSARFSGERLHKKTDTKNERITKHSIEFCTLLCAAAEKYAKSSKALNTRKKVVDSAMRYDVRSSLRP